MRIFPPESHLSREGGDLTEIRVLLVESNLEDARFLQEALAEISETAPPDSWTAYRALHVESIEDACAVAALGECDITLLNPGQSARSPFAALAALRDAAPDVPVAVILDVEDGALGRRMLREGAQDFLIKSEIDCAPLARAIRNAIERQRFLTSARGATAFDDLTGLYNSRGFSAAADREWHLAAAVGQSLLIVLAEVDNLEEIIDACGADRRVLTLLDAAEVLRAGAGDGALLACLNGSRFAALVWALQPEDLIARIQSELANHPRPFAFAFGWAAASTDSTGGLADVLTAAEASLCENRQSYQHIPVISPSMPPTGQAAVSRA